MQCAYCERPLICDACEAPFQPEGEEQYAALSADEEAIACPSCGEVLVCHWCKTAYDGEAEDEAEAGEG